MSDAAYDEAQMVGQPGAHKLFSPGAMLSLCALIGAATACLNPPEYSQQATSESDAEGDGRTESTGTESTTASDDEGDSTMENAGDEEQASDEDGQSSSGGLKLDWRHDLQPGKSVVPIQVVVDEVGNAIVLFSILGGPSEDSDIGVVAKYDPDGEEFLRAELDASVVSAVGLEGYQVVLGENDGAYLLAVAKDEDEDRRMVLQHLDERFQATATVELGAFSSRTEIALDVEGRPTVLRWDDVDDLKRENFGKDLKLREIQQYVLKPGPSDLKGAACRFNSRGEVIAAYPHERDGIDMVRYAFFDGSATLQWMDDYYSGHGTGLYGVEIDEAGAAYLFLTTWSEDDSRASRQDKYIFMRLNAVGKVDWAKHVPWEPDGHKTNLLRPEGAVANEAGLFVHSVHQWSSNSGTEWHGLLQVRHYDIEGNEVWHFGQRQELDPADSMPGRIAALRGEQIYVLTGSLRPDEVLSSAFISRYLRARELQLP